jgi:hypothetical protein
MTTNEVFALETKSLRGIMRVEGLKHVSEPVLRLPYDSSPFILSPVISSRSFRPLVISYPVISSPGHLVPWSSRPLLSHHPIQFNMCKIIQFHMCKIILKMWYVALVTFITTWGLSFHYIYSDTCVTVVTLHTGVTHVTIVTWHTMSHLHIIGSLQ